MSEESVWNAATWSGQYDEDATWATGSPGIPPGHLIVDSAAGQALIGEAACVEWEQKVSTVGLRGVRVHSKMMTPKGVGGTAHPTRSMMMPTMIDGLSGVLQYTVVKEDIPGLLPLSFQEKQGAMINLRTNKLHLPHLRAVVPMHRTQGGHRTIDVTMIFEFNRLIALDVFYIPLRGQSLPILNITCHGTNFQIVALMRQDGTPTASMVWSTFQRSWRRYFGTPDVMITDGGPEFRGDFAQSGEYAGILQVVVDADAPWQNGKCERHGGLVKDLLAKGLETEVVFTPDDLEDLLAEIVSLKNRRGNRGGFTPYQLVIGQNPRVPHELLSDDAVDEVGMQELSRDDADLDSPATAFRQSMRIRDHARMLMETHTARERLRSAGKAQFHRDRNYHRGQWVYVRRRDLRGARDRTSGPSLSRWVGPGLVALQDDTTVWVSMRGRLWKCARE